MVSFQFPVQVVCEAAKPGKNPGLFFIAKMRVKCHSGAANVCMALPHRHRN